jgi:hypothetical protein
LNASTDSIASNIIMFTNSLVQQNSSQMMHRTIKIRTGAFFPLVKQQQITKTTSILWNTQSKKEEDKYLASTEHCILFSLQVCSIVGIINIHRQEKQNNITSIPK